MRYTPGDVFVAIGSGEVQEFTPTGVLVQTLNDTTGSTYTAGMAFDIQGNLYVTNFSLGMISEFDINGNLINANFVSGTGQVTPESISLPGGQFPAIVGDADFHDQNGNGIISQYDSTGALLTVGPSRLKVGARTGRIYNQMAIPCFTLRKASVS